MLLNLSEYAYLKLCIADIDWDIEFREASCFSSKESSWKAGAPNIKNVLFMLSYFSGLSSKYVDSRFSIKLSSSSFF